MSNACEDLPHRVPTESHGVPKFSISQVSTLAASFADDVRSYAEGGVDAIGIWELKLGDGPDDDALASVEASRIFATTAVPAVPSILPLPLLPVPEDPRISIDYVMRSIHRLPAYRTATGL